MTALAEKIKPQFAGLSTADRAELARFLLESLDEPADPAAGQSWEAELKRRADEIHNGTAEGRPVDEALADLRKRYS
jgi:putative addiction module component (TIGR02574 family)